MKITRIEIRKLKLPMTRSFSLGYGTVEHKETVIVNLYTADGLVGYGESTSFAAPIYMRETNDSCMYVQEKFIAPRVLGGDFDTVEQFQSAYATVIGNQAAKMGIECAFWHLIAQRDNVSLKRLLGGTRNEISVGESIGIKPTIEETLTEITQRLQEGYLRIKIKIEPGWDLQVLRAVREQWSNIDLAVDANTSYEYEKHYELLQQLDEFHLSMIEQPFGIDSIVGHAKLQKILTTPLCLDESIESMGNLATVEAIGACRIVNVKPVRVGGLLESSKIHDFARKHDIKLLCGGMFETGIGRAFNIALASREGFVLPADMSPYQLYFAEDVIEPSYVVKPNGCIDVSNKPGLGYDIRENFIEKFTIKKIILK